MNTTSRSVRRTVPSTRALLWTLALTIVKQVQAQPANGTLTAENVLASSARHYPSVLERIATRRGAEGELTRADGAFDLVFSADGFSRLTGFYDGSAIKGGVRQNLPTLGSSIYADYRLSNGEFPIYEDASYTNELGEIKLGVIFSLLRDRDLDDRRFERIDARLSLRETQLDLLLTQIGVQRRALIAYWRWVTAGRTLEVYEDLLTLARDRQAGLEEQFRRGAQAEIFLIENQQNIARRETFVTNARRDLRFAANELSLFHRDDEGLPLVPQPAEIPPALSAGTVEPLALPDPGDAVSALANRPELELLRTALERAQFRVALAENSMKPRIDLNVELARDFGDIAEGGLSRDGTEAIVGISFSVPLQQRSARGRIRQETAQIEAIRHRQRLREDQIAIEIENIIVNLNASEEMLQLAANQVELTERVREAEQRRFQNGASDFFLVNIREESAANARIQFYAADLERRIARADYDAAIVDLERLGLDARR